MGSEIKKHIIAQMAIVITVIICLSCVVFGEVNTAHKVVDGAATVYVAGNDDFYPIEYYNKETEKYEGVMPKILEDISKKTGIDFTYIHNGETQEALANSLQVEVVSAYITDSNRDYVENSSTVFSCINDNKNIQIGWGYTAIADPEVIRVMEEAAKEISDEEINGYLLLGSQKQEENDLPWFINIIFALICVFVLIFAWYSVKKIKKTLDKNEMTDFEMGVGNSLYFEHCFYNFITDTARSLYYIAYIVIDDNYLEGYHEESMFKNSIRYTASVLKSYARNNEFVARVGENEFVYMYQSPNQLEAQSVIDSVMSRLDSYAEKNQEMEKYYSVALYNLRQNDRSCELLLFSLRKSCNSILKTEKNFIFCDASMINKVAEEKKLVESILQGLKNNEFKPYFQFIVDNKTKNIVSAEALSRWESPDMGLITPGRYIKAMELSGHIPILEYYMFEMCCRQLHKWRETDFGNLTISCNFTRITISAPDFVDKITEIAKKYVFDSNKLVIEITEDTLEKHFDRAIENINRCKELGYRIALDDLGTGYTSLANLCDYPIDIVKIDREILLKTDNSNGRGLFMGIISLAHSLGLKVVCEGVETKEQKELVDKTDCDYVQGWYYSRVFPDREGEDYARKYMEQVKEKGK